MRMIENWTSQIWSLASMRVAWAATLLTGIMLAAPDMWAQMMDGLPWWGRVIVTLLVGSSLMGSRLIAFKGTGDGHA